MTEDSQLPVEEGDTVERKLHAALCKGFLLCQVGHIWTQHFTQLLGHPPVVFLNSVSVGAKQETRRPGGA